MIGLDVTSIMILSYLDLLETAIEAFHHVKLSPDIMEFLLRERDEVRFHQPSRIVAARQVRDLKNQGRLRAADDVADPPKALTDEVGLDLAALLHGARQDNGRVICVLPLHRIGSLMEEQADKSGYDDLIHSTIDLCTLLHAEGRIAAADYQRACLFLNSQGQREHADFSSSILQGPIYLDRTALSYLQDAGILQLIAAAGLDIRIHTDVFGRNVRPHRSRRYWRWSCGKNRTDSRCLTKCERFGSGLFPASHGRPGRGGSEPGNTIPGDGISVGGQRCLRRALY